MDNGYSSMLESQIERADGLDEQGNELVAKSDTMKDIYAQRLNTKNPFAGGLYNQTTNEYAQSIMVNNDGLTVEHMNHLNKIIFNQYKD
jgi:hypothetical protein